MKILVSLIAVMAAAWLGLWGANLGILVYSADNLAVMRDCRYFIGVSVVKRLAPLAQRCELIRKVGD